jgi:hypothetical protein
MEKQQPALTRKIGTITKFLKPIGPGLWVFYLNEMSVIIEWTYGKARKTTETVKTGTDKRKKALNKLSRKCWVLNSIYEHF